MTNGKAYAFLATGTALLWGGMYFSNFWVGLLGGLTILWTIDYTMFKEKDCDE